jgi:site-specific DNA-methyltransferase (adenine-specific)
MLINGDCLEKMKDIPDKSIDMILCDLPYGTTACKWDTIIPFEPLWEQYKRIIKDNGAIVLTASQPFTSALVMSNIKMFKYELIWDKKTGLGFLDSKFRPLKSHENVLVFGLGGCSNGSKTPMKYNPQGLIETTKQNTNSKSNILNSEPNKRKNLGTTHTNYPKSIHTFSREAGLHPTQKPIALMEFLIKTYTNEGDLVLDNCMGSGSTGVACKNTNRRFIGIEKDENYFKIAEKRINDIKEGCLF